METRKETRLVWELREIYVAYTRRNRYARDISRWLIQLLIVSPISSTKMPDNFFVSICITYKRKGEETRRVVARWTTPVSCSITRLIKNRWIKGTYKHSWKMSDTGNGRRKAGRAASIILGVEETRRCPRVCLKVCSLEASQSLCVSIDSYWVGPRSIKRK